MFVFKQIFNNHKYGYLVVLVLSLLLIPLYFTQGAECENPGICIPNALEGIIYSMAVGIGGFFLWLGGALLDYAVKELVLEMGQYMQTGVGFAVDSLWVMVRDTFNVVFIFGIIYIGFKTILSLDNFDTKKTLGLLIVAALMINFSLFITKAIVDVSNATAAQIYASSIGKKQITAEGTQPIAVDGAAPNPEGISYQFMNMFRMTTFAATNAENLESNSFLVGRLAFFGLLMMFVMLIAAFVFAAGAFLMVARFVGLIIFMIFSPAMFAGLIFPHKIFSEYTRLWWQYFLKYAFVGPAYLFMLYLALFVLASGIDFRTGGGFAAAFTQGSVGEGAFIIFLHFFVIAGFLVAALLVAQKMSIYGADASMGMLKGAGNGLRSYATSTGKRLAGGATFGLGARLGRNTIGAAANKYTGSDFGRRMALKSGVAGALGRTAIRTADKTRNASFDARKVGGLGKKLGIGEGQKGGYAQRQKDIIKKEEDATKLIAAGGDMDQLYADANVTDIKSTYDGVKQKRNALIRELSRTIDPERRITLTNKINDFNDGIKKIEESTHAMPESFAEAGGTKEQWEKKLKDFNHLRKNAKAILSNEYAANLEARGDNLWPVAREMYHFTLRSRSENKAAAEKIRKDIGKSKEEQLVDSISKTFKKDEENS